MKGKKLLMLVGSVCLILVLAACPAPPEETPTPTTPTPTTPTPTTPTGAVVYGPAWDKIVAAAKAEGELNGYATEFTGERGKAIQDTFGDKYGIKINGVGGISSAVVERLKVEAATGRVIGDVCGITMPNQALLYKEGLLQEFVSKLPEWELTKEDGWKVDPTRLDGHLIVTQGTVWAPGINTNLVKGDDIPTSWYDLLDPKWDGKLVMDSPTLQGAIYWLYLAMPQMGIDRDDYFEKLGKNHPMIKENVYVVWNAVKDGIAHMSVNGYYQFVSQNRPAGAPIQITAPKEGWYFSEGSNMSIVKDCPHPNAALLFMNWYLTEEGTRVVTEAGGLTMVLRKGMKDYWDQSEIAGPILPIEKIFFLTTEDWENAPVLQQSGYLEELMGLPVLK